MRLSNEILPPPGQRGRGQSPGNGVPTYARHTKPRSNRLFLTYSASHPPVLLPGQPRRASEGTPLLTGLPPAPGNNSRSQKKPIHLHSKLKQEPMIGNALIVTIAILLALGFWLMGELKFLTHADRARDGGGRPNREAHPLSPVTFSCGSAGTHGSSPLLHTKIWNC
jgi:hypothetical protein